MNATTVEYAAAFRATCRLMPSAGTHSSCHTAAGSDAENIQRATEAPEPCCRLPSTAFCAKSGNVIMKRSMLKETASVRHQAAPPGSKNRAVSNKRRRQAWVLRPGCPPPIPPLVALQPVASDRHRHQTRPGGAKAAAPGIFRRVEFPGCLFLQPRRDKRRRRDQQDCMMKNHPPAANVKKKNTSTAGAQCQSPMPAPRHPRRFF